MKLDETHVSIMMKWLYNRDGLWFWFLLVSFVLSKWWQEAQENKKLVANPKDTKVKRKLRSLEVHQGFPNPAVAQAYLHPAVDPSEASFSWGRPHIELIKEYPSTLWMCFTNLFMFIFVFNLFYVYAAVVE